MNTPRNHKVAQAAYQRIEKRQHELTSTNKSSYEALAHKLPTMILQNGLAQATGFLLAKGSSEHTAILEDVATVLTEIGVPDCQTPRQMHQTIIHADVNKTMLLTRRALEASAALKRYVQGVMKTTPNDSHGIEA